MNNYVLDSWAWIEYFDGTKIGEKVREHIKKDAVFTSAVTLTEVISKMKRRRLDADSAFDAITSVSKVILITEISAKEAGLIHAAVKASKSNFSFGDAYALQTARRLGAKVLTGDPDFKGIKEAEMLK